MKNLTAIEFAEKKQYELAEYDEGGFLGINTKVFAKLLEEYRSQASELPSDEEMKDWASIHSIANYHDGLPSQKNFIEGYLYAVDFYKNNYASPLLASKDARMKELEEELKEWKLIEDGYKHDNTSLRELKRNCDPIKIETDIHGFCKECHRNLGYVRK